MNWGQRLKLKDLLASRNLDAQGRLFVQQLSERDETYELSSEELTTLRRLYMSLSDTETALPNQEY